MSDEPSEAATPPEGMREVTRPAVVVPEQRPPATRTLGPWWVVVLGVGIALAFVATDHMLRATLSLGGSLLAAAALRAVLPQDRAGGLVVRSAWFDVVALVILGVAVLVSGFTLDLTAR